ncbi:MAG: DUF2029 domain-containing protein [Chloroflexi bacterium]|nr:DUF2029 domain-containing protein [Chloroflexota bacterium]
MTLPNRLGRFWLILIIPLLAWLSYAVAIRIVNSIDYQKDYSDFVPFWLAGNLVANGQSPYDTALWVDGYAGNGVGEMIDHSFLYPLPLAFFFVPLGMLPLRAAHVLWVAATLFIILGVTLALPLTRESPKAKPLLIHLLIGVIFFRPAVLSVTTGHISGLLLLLLVGSLFLFERDKPFWGGFLFTFLMLKPNLGAVLIPLLVIWLLRRKMTHAFWGMAFAGLLMLTAGLLYDLHWLSEYWQVGSGKLAQTFGFSPTVWGLAHLTCNQQQSCVLAVGGVAAIVLTGLVLWLLVRFPHVTPLNAFSLSIALTLLITPYIWTYDQLLLLIPIATIIFFFSERKGGLIPAALFFLAVDFLAVFLLVYNTGLQVEILNGFIPLVILGFALYSTRRQTHPPSSEY